MNFNFLRYTKIWFTLSIVTVLLGVGAMIYNKVQYGTALELGIDFTGGSRMEMSLTGEEVDRDQLREVIEKAYPNSVEQITVTDAMSYIVQTKEMTEEQRVAVTEALQDEYAAFELLNFTSIGPKIGSSLKTKAIIALSVAMVAIVLYIAYAFRNVPRQVGAWRFGFVAILALLHDVLTTVGVFALLGYEVNALFITALLTVIGFSVHDTIVVFDRIRENLKNQARGESFDEIANNSLNQTLARSINTSLSTLFPLFALYFWGAESIHEFVFALIVGILVGAYSSIFIAAPVLVWWQKRR